MRLNSLLREFPQSRDSEIVRSAYRRAIECVKLSGEAAEDPDLYEIMANNILTATRSQHELNFVRLTNRAIDLYRSRRTPKNVDAKEHQV
jgi:hypothetical protein